MFVCETMKETVMGYQVYGCNLNASANEKKKILECFGEREEEDT